MRDDELGRFFDSRKQLPEGVEELYDKLIGHEHAEDLMSAALATIADRRDKKRAKQSNQSQGPWWLLGRRPPDPAHTQAPGDDHTYSLRLRKGDRLCYISEPYNLSLGQIKEMIAFAEQWGLDFVLDGKSRWYPGWTLRVVWTRSSTNSARQPFQLTATGAGE